MQYSFAVPQLVLFERMRKAFLLANGVMLTIVGTGAAVSDLIAYCTGSGPLGAHLFNAPYAGIPSVNPYQVWAI